METVFFDWQSMMRELGPVIGILLFFIWRDWKRETHLSKRIEKLEDYQRETLVHLVEKGTAALVQSSEVIKWVGRVIDRVTTKCPYMQPPHQEIPRLMEDNDG